MEHFKIIHDGQTGVITKVALTDEEIADRAAAASASALASLRAERDRLLGETDVFALADRTISDEMRAYRQALRDLPANTSDPANPTWPTKPGG